MIKKIKMLSVGFLIGSSLQAEVVTVAPYSGVLSYDNNSSKNSGTINGFYASSGTLNYLMEFSYAATDIKYKYATTNLTQDEFTFVYNRYWKSHALKVGIHTNSTTDKSLQNGITLILGGSKWKWYGYSKLTYGLDYYTTEYANGQDLEDNNVSVRVNQLSPYISYYKPFSLNTKTFTSLKINLENINAYTSDKSYRSYELKNTIYYKKAYLELGVFGGKFRTGIKDNGMTVYNSKDIIKKSLSAKIGYYINTKLNTSLAYSSSTYDEYEHNSENTNTAVVISASYRF